MLRKNNIELIYLLFIMSIWIIYFAPVFSLSIVFMSVHSALLISSLVATVFSVAFIIIQRTMHGLDRLQSFK